MNDLSFPSCRRVGAKRAKAGLVLGLALALMASSCGLGTVLYYERPFVAFEGDSTGAGGGTLKIDHNNANTSAGAFLGYELYYRGYQNQEAANKAYKTILEKSNSANIAPSFLLPQLENGTLSELQGQRFYKMSDAAGKDPTPFLRYKPADSAYHIAIRKDDWQLTIINAGTTSAPAAVNRASTLVIQSEPRSFYETTEASTWKSTDADYSGDATIAGTSTVYFVGFVVAYGFDFTSNFATLYSMPAVFSGSPEGSSVPIPAH